jgi:hypothetical protein
LKKNKPEYDNTGVVFLKQGHDGSFNGNITVDGVKHFIKAYRYNGKVPFLRLKVYDWQEQNKE